MSEFRRERHEPVALLPDPVRSPAGAPRVEMKEIDLLDPEVRLGAELLPTRA